MMKPTLHRRTSRSRKKNVTPLSNLRTSEVVRTVVANPRRLDELVNLLQNRERLIRGRAATTLARLSESHPARLVRHLEHLRGAIGDDSAYVRWHLLYTLGQVISRFPKRSSPYLGEICAHLTDEDRLVRSFACRALEKVAARKPQLISALYSAKPDDIPPSVARLLQHSVRPGKEAKGS
jgi:HEAT repeat protein